MEARQLSHGHLSDSDRESPELPRKAEHSMMRLRRASPPAAAPSLRAAQLNRPAVSQQDGSQCTTPGRTSRLEVPASDPMRRRPGCSEPCRRLPSQSPHEYERRIQPTDANDTGLHVPQSCGRSGVALFNTVRPHSSLDYQTPAEFAAKLEQTSASVQATGRDAAVYGAFAPGPLLNRPARGIRNHQQRMPSQAKTGPKK